MAYGFLDIATTPSVRAVQAGMGVAEQWQNFTGQRESDRFGANEAGFIADRDSFYLASTSETGWPYIQHRGGPRGFLRLLDERTLGFADYRGNRQYISTGNIAAHDRVCLFLMDYPRRARLKIYARAEILALDADPALAEQLGVAPYRARPERLFRLHLASFDWNCAQHITPRYTEREVAVAIHPLRTEIARLEAENAALRARLAQDPA